MTVNKTLDAIEVMQAFTNGKQIEARLRPDPQNHYLPAYVFEWNIIESRLGHTPSWDWEHCDYRVAPVLTKS